MVKPKSLEELPRLSQWKARGKEVKLKEAGVQVFYVASEDFEAAKNGSKPKLILVHGYPTASADFRRILPELEKRFDIFTWDFVGYGFSQKVYRTIQQQIDILQELIQQEMGYTNTSPVALHILSHDLGDTLAQEMLARVLEDQARLNFEIESFVALNGGLLPGEHRPTFMQRMLVNPVAGPVLARLSNINIMHKSISKVFGPSTKPTELDIQEFYYLITCNNGKRLVNRNIRYMLERVRYKDRWVNALSKWSEQNNGMLLIDGPADPVSGRHLANALQARIPKATVEMLADDIGHWPQLEDPKSVLQKFFQYHQEKRNTFHDVPEIEIIPE